MNDDHIGIDSAISRTAPRKPKTKPSYEVVNDREIGMMKRKQKQRCCVIEVVQPGVDAEARWVKKGGKSVLAISSTH